MTGEVTILKWKNSYIKNFVNFGERVSKSKDGGSRQEPGKSWSRVNLHQLLNFLKDGLSILNIAITLA